MQKIADDRVTALRPVTPQIDRTGIAGTFHHVMDVIEPDDVVVAVDHDRNVRGIVNAITLSDVAHTRQAYSGPVGGVPQIKIVNIVVLCHQVARG